MVTRLLQACVLALPALLACAAERPEPEPEAPEPALPDSGPAPAAEPERSTTPSPRTQGRAEVEAAPAASPAAPAGEPRVVEAVGALERGELERAHALVASMLFEERLALGRDLLSRGQLREAARALDAAAALDPTETELLVLRGEAWLAIGIEDENLASVEDALASFRLALPAGGPRAILGAARAAYQLERYDEALELAREGVAALGEGPIPELPEPPSRTWARAAFRGYLAAREAEPERAAELFEETERALWQTLGDAPGDPWPWLQLSYLYEYDGRLDEAREAVLSGLSYQPEDFALHERLAAVARRIGGEDGGRQAVVAAYDAFRAAHPDVATGLWYHARERFDLALDEGMNGAEDAETFRELEREFARCRGLDGGYHDACIGYELVCRDAAGWCLYNGGDLDGAREAFQSMEDLLPHGMEEWSIEDRLPSGVVGLEYVASRYREDETSAESQRKAAAIYDFLHVYKPDDVEFATNAGFYNRDAAVLLAQEAERLGEELAAATVDDIERRRRQAQIDRLEASAMEAMQRSYAAYADAARLAPDDIRIQNDTGLVLTLYLQNDLETAERYLLRAVELGKVQLQNPDLGEEERFELENTWGDAFQNLGRLYLSLKNDPVKAREYFERALAIGPEPRPLITEEYLPNCELSEEGKLDLDTYTWGPRRR